MIVAVKMTTQIYLTRRYLSEFDKMETTWNYDDDCEKPNTKSSKVK